MSTNNVNTNSNSDLLESLLNFAKTVNSSEAQKYILEAMDIREKMSDKTPPEFNVKVVPKEPEKAFELMTEYAGKISYLIHKASFLITNGVWDKHKIQLEIDALNSEMNIGRNANPAKSLSFNFLRPDESLPLQYQLWRLENDIYKGEDFAINDIPYISELALVYGKYYLFLPFLEEKLNEMNLDQPKVRIKLEDVIIDKHYNELVNILATNDIIDNFSLRWINKERGYKKQINTFFTHIENYGFSDGKITKEERKAIAKNTFNVDISIETFRADLIDESNHFSFLKSYRKNG